MDNIKNFFSIITPVRDGSKFIDRYLNCLNNQTFKHWEAIIIDDGSKDMSFEKLCFKTKNDSRFKVLKNLQSKILDSPYLARNIGLENAKGRYICFLDIDDIWLPNKLMRQYEIISSNKNHNLIFSSYYRYQEKYNKFIERKPIKFIKINSLIDFLNPVPMLSACVKSEIVSKVRFKPEYHEDYIFWKEIISQIPENSIFIDNIPTTVYFITNNSLSSNKFKSIFWILKIYFLEDKNFFLLIFKFFVRAFFQIYIYFTDKEINKNILKNFFYYKNF